MREKRTGKKRRKAEARLPGAKNGGRIRAISREHERLAQWLETVRFQKTLFGGVKETRLWKQLEELNGLYEAAISAERVRYDALLRERMEAYRTQGGRDAAPADPEQASGSEVHG